MENATRQFKDTLKKSYAQQLGKSEGADGQMIKDLMKYSSEMKENKFKDKTSEKINKEFEIEKIDKSAKKQFKQDLQLDPDFLEFKKNSKYKDQDKEFTFGTPNVTLDDPYIKKKKYSRVGKSETKEATGTGSAGAFEGPLFGGDVEFYKKSQSETPKLNGKNVTKKIETQEERRKPFRNDRKKVKKAKNSEGVTFEVGKKAKTFDTKKEITIHSLNKINDKIMAFYMDGIVGKEIDIDGLESINEEVEKVEATEATGTGSSGGYETPAMWAKSTKKKDWGPSRKPQYKGGSFVSVKKKCTKFPYCNQGDIKALNIYKNESVKNAISEISKKLNLSETTIKAMIEFELEKLNKH
jgi:hypothetical protein